MQQQKDKENVLTSVKMRFWYMLGGVAIIVLFLGIIFHLKGAKDKSELQSPGEINWQLEIPHDYAIYASGNYQCKYFVVDYSYEDATYYVTVLQGKEYDFEQVKDWICLKLTEFDEMQDVLCEEVHFTDYRQ